MLEFKNLSDLKPEDVDYLTDDIVRGEVRKTLPQDAYMVVTKQNLEIFLAAQQIRLEDACEGSCEVDVGRKIGVHLIVTGKVRRTETGEILVSMQMYNTKSGEFLGSDEARGRGVDETARELRLSVGRLLSYIPGLIPAGSAAAPRFVASGQAPAGTAVPLFATPGQTPGGRAEAGVTKVNPTAAPAAAATGAAGLYITTDPPGAEVYLGSVKVGATSPAFQRFDLQPGTTVRVTLRKPAYHDKVFDVELRPGMVKYQGEDGHGVKLAPAFGSLVIQSEPPGAKVTIGGQAKGVTPYREERVPSGEHLVTVELGLYRPVSEVVVVKDGEPTEKRYRLDADFGTVGVDSEPRGAAILVARRDKETGGAETQGTAMGKGKTRGEMGKTPAELRLSPGEYEVTLNHAGYRSQAFQVVVARGSRVEISAREAALVRKEFNLTVVAEPPEPGARIYLDGNDTGKTAPEMISGLAEGTHTVEVKAEKMAGRVDVAGSDGEAKTVTVALEVGLGTQSSGRFTVSVDGVVTDSQTGLEWYVGPDKDTNWDEAASWVRSLSVAGGGWRLPTRAELKSLCQKRGFWKTKLDPVLNTGGWWVWSGEENDASSAWGFDFSPGQEINWDSRPRSEGKSSGEQAFAVRSQR